MDSLQHKPGVKVGKDAAPEFSAETYPPGTAPREHTYQPNPEQSESPHAAGGPLDTLPGSTSRDVHNATQYGKPAQGQTSAERHHGGSGSSGSHSSGKTGDGSVQGKARGLGADLEGRAGEAKGQRGASGAAEGGTNWPAAEERLPTSAEELASELPKGGHSGVVSGERAV